VRFAGRTLHAGQDAGRHGICPPNLADAALKANRERQERRRPSDKGGTGFCDVLCDVTHFISPFRQPSAAIASLTRHMLEIGINTGQNAVAADCCYFTIENLGARGPRFESARPDQLSCEEPLNWHLRSNPFLCPLASGREQQRRNPLHSLTLRLPPSVPDEPHFRF